jgi:hypothetical protein
MITSQRLAGARGAVLETVIFPDSGDRTTYSGQFLDRGSDGMACAGLRSSERYQARMRRVAGRTSGLGQGTG